MCNHVSNEAMKVMRDMFALTHDVKLKAVTHEGVSNFQSLLNHWISVHAMKNPEPFCESAHITIDDSYRHNEALKKFMLDLGLSFNDTRPVMDASCANACIKLRTNK